MRVSSVLAAGVLACLVLLPLGASAQSLQAGTWTGFVTPPGGMPFEATFDVRYPESDTSTIVVMTVSDWGTSFPLRNVHTVQQSLRFWWSPIERVDCELDRADDAVYRGECWDENGTTSPMVMAPPGQDVTGELRQIVEAAERARLMSKKWEVRRALDRNIGLVGENIDVGGYSLNVRSEGEGAPVLFLSDIGDDLRVWDYVSHDVKDFARAVSYSRSGVGHSDAAPADITIDQRVEEMHALLEEIAVSSPIVLVGHAFGSVLAQAFAEAYPDRVAGLVLLEPPHPDEGQVYGELDRDGWRAYMERKTALFDLAPKAVGAEFDLYRALVSGRKDGSAPQPERVPTYVLSSTRVVETPRWIGESRLGVEAKLRLHEAIAGHSRGGRHVLTSDSGPFIPREDPDVVIEAIRELVNQNNPEDAAPN